MKRILISILTIAIVFVTASAIVPNQTYATSLDDMQKKAKSFFNKGKPEADKILPQNTLEEKFIPVGQILVTAASIVLVIVTLIMAIKYITANPEQRGKLKQQLIGLVISIVVIYGAVGIWSIVKTTMENSGL